MSASLMASRQLMPGTSSIHPIHHAPSCLTTAVNSLFISRPLPLRPSLASACNRPPWGGGRPRPGDRVYPSCGAGAARPPGRREPPGSPGGTVRIGKIRTGPSISCRFATCRPPSGFPGNHGRPISERQATTKDEREEATQERRPLPVPVEADARNRTEDPSLRVVPDRACGAAPASAQTPTVPPSPLFLMGVLARAASCGVCLPRM